MRSVGALFIVLMLAVLPAASACGGEGDETGGTAAGTATGVGTVPVKPKQNERWEDEGLRLAGRYADADVVALDNGGYRMYFGAEPEVQGFQGQIYSAVSRDGLDWTMEDGVRMLDASFPDVVRLPDGRWRMYYQGAGAGGEPGNGIASAVSDDGVNWTREDGLRIRQGLQGAADVKDVADPTVIGIDDGGYLMVYRGQAGERRHGPGGDRSGSPEPNDFLISATSPDGINWTAGGVVIDSRNDEMRGQILGPDLVVEDGAVRLHCNSYAGIYAMTLDESGAATDKPVLVVESSGSPSAGDLFAPGDVSVIRMGDAWRMFYGLHTKGIHSMKLV
jgi:hypothetical protein